MVEEPGTQWGLTLQMSRETRSDISDFALGLELKLKMNSDGSLWYSVIVVMEDRLDTVGSG